MCYCAYSEDHNEYKIDCSNTCPNDWSISHATRFPALSRTPTDGRFFSRSLQLFFNDDIKNIIATWIALRASWSCNASRNGGFCVPCPIWQNQRCIRWELRIRSLTRNSEPNAPQSHLDNSLLLFFIHVERKAFVRFDILKVWAFPFYLEHL